MRESRIKAKWARGEPALVTTLHLTDASAWELAGLMGFDGIWLDLEHHGHSVETAHELIRAARIGDTDVLARPGKGEFTRLARLLEAGASGVLYPRCSDAEEAKAVVRWAKFHPLGKRGFDGGCPDMPYCSMSMPEYVEKANRETFVAVQIEDARAVENARSIAQVRGVDALFFGPADFTVLSGIPGQFDHPVVREAIDRVADAAARSKKQWGMPCFSLDHAREIMGKGARLIASGADILMVKSGLEKLRSDFQSLGFRFDPKI